MTIRKWPSKLTCRCGCLATHTRGFEPACESCAAIKYIDHGVAHSQRGLGHNPMPDRSVVEPYHIFESSRREPVHYDGNWSLCES